MTRRIAMAVGFCAFVAAFFLPAVLYFSSDEQRVERLPGWSCALFALYTTGSIFQVSSSEISKDTILLALSGLVNPMVLLYLALNIWSSLQRIRWTVMSAIFGCLAATWVLLYISHETPLIGHYVWVVGIFTMLAAELLRKGPRTIESRSDDSESKPEAATGSNPLNPQD